MLAVAFVVGAVSPAMALSKKQKRNIKIIKIEARKKKLSKSQITALLKICKRESWYVATARTGSCKGLFQLKTSYPRSKWANPAWNTRKAIRYIKHRYGTPKKALAHCYRYGWY